MTEALLHNRDYTFILARNASLHSSAIPGLEQKWLEAENSLINLAQKCQHFDSDGLTVYIASTPYQKYEVTNCEDLSKIFQAQYACTQPDLVETIQASLNDYFQRKANKQTQVNGEIITILLEQEPKNRRALVKMLVEATYQMEKQSELGIMFAQVGDDSITRGFLSALDDDLQAAGAKFNLADTQIFSEMEENAISEFLLNALYG